MNKPNNDSDIYNQTKNINEDIRGKDINTQIQILRNIYGLEIIEQKEIDGYYLIAYDSKVGILVENKGVICFGSGFLFDSIIPQIEEDENKNLFIEKVLIQDGDNYNMFQIDGIKATEIKNTKEIDEFRKKIAEYISQIILKNENDGTIDNKVNKRKIKWKGEIHTLN